mmetsp:Transcript_82275/g.145815  ORF Transcript_82275/g.145815 Transcript_82275/m.145815 type:complete len:202 (+) Transcript_82275:311-916(+)
MAIDDHRQSKIRLFAAVLFLAFAAVSLQYVAHATTILPRGGVVKCSVAGHVHRINISTGIQQCKHQCLYSAVCSEVQRRLPMAISRIHACSGLKQKLGNLSCNACGHLPSAVADVVQGGLSTFVFRIDVHATLAQHVRHCLFVPESCGIHERRPAVLICIDCQLRHGLEALNVSSAGARDGVPAHASWVRRSGGVRLTELE